MARKLNNGYKKPEKKEDKVKKDRYVSHLFLAKPKEVSTIEKVVKFLIYSALRLVIKPSRWKVDKEKNYELIDRVYKRIMSSDFIYIPSSIAFHLIMAFLPMLSLIVALSSFIQPNSLDPNAFGNLFRSGLTDTIGKFIPGVTAVINQLRHSISSSSTNHLGGIDVGATVALIFTFMLSTWISASGFAKIIYTQSYIFKHKFMGGYWMNKIKGMFMTIAFAITLAILLAINIVVAWAIKNDSTILHVGQQALIYIFLIITLIIGIFIGSLILFRFSPRFKIEARNVLPGTLVVTIPASGFLALFGTISSMWSYGSYGTVGLIMYVGMASLIITYFLFVGIATNAAYYKTFIGSKMKLKKTISKK